MLRKHDKNMPVFYVMLVQPTATLKLVFPRHVLPASFPPRLGPLTPGDKYTCSNT